LTPVRKKRTIVRDMRTRVGHKQKGLAEALWPTGRRAILGLMLADASREWHLREIARRAGLSPATAHDEIASLVAAGILARRTEARRAYYRANTACPIYSELRSIILKTVGLADVLRSALAGVPGIEAAFVYGSMAKGEEVSGSDVDLMIIGSVSMRDLVTPLHRAEETLGREVNATVYPEAEFREKLASRHHFLSTVMAEPKLFVVGDADVVERMARAGMAARAQAKSAGNRRSARGR